MKSSMKWTLAAAAATAWLVPGQAGAQRATMAIGQSASRMQSGTGNFFEVGRPFVPHRGGWNGRHGRGSWRGTGWALVGGWGGGLYEDPEAFRDAGFFAEPADVRVEGGRAVFDYDRGYPYDWYRDPRDRAGRTAPLVPREARIACSVEAAGVRVCRRRN